MVARLFVSPRARGQGAGALLLDTAAAAAAARGLWPGRDVDTELAPAIALYESRGWTRAGTITVRWSSARLAGERVLTEYVYLGPGPDSPAQALRPPSIRWLAPVTYSASSDSRYTTRLATSAAVP